MRFRLVKDQISSGSVYHWVEKRSFFTLGRWVKCSQWMNTETEARNKFIEIMANRGTKIIIAEEGSMP